jgi:hypothetical protein
VLSMLRVELLQCSQLHVAPEGNTTCTASAFVKGGGAKIVSATNRVGESGFVVWRKHGFVGLGSSSGGISSQLKVESNFQERTTSRCGITLLPGAFLERMPKLASVQKTLLIKLSPSTASEEHVQLAVKVDFIAGSVDEQIDLAQLTLEARYDRLLGFLRKQNEARSEEATTSGAGPASVPSHLDHSISSLEDKAPGLSSSLLAIRLSQQIECPILWEGREAGTVSNVHVRVGTIVSFGMPLFDVMLDKIEDAADMYGNISGASNSPGPRGPCLYDQMAYPKCDLHVVTVNYVEKISGRVKELKLLATGSRVEPQEVVLVVEQGVDKPTPQENLNKYNDEFQTLVEVLARSVASGMLHSSCLDTCKKLHGVIHNFTETARIYERVIISELHLPVSEKTIKPSHLGGMLGGSKYIVRNVLFKTPSATGFSSYPDPWLISHKIQGHELKGCSAYFSYFFNSGVSGIVSFPLMAVIDYKGYRITAMAQLPVDGDRTLIYGCSNAGENCDVLNKIPAWSQFIRDASINGLNLAPHYVVNGRAEGGEIELASCIDLEGHAGFDNRFYLLDFSRAIPAAFKRQPKPYDTFWHCYNMLRQEFVCIWGRNHKPLSADSFSCFQVTITADRKVQAKAANENAIEAEGYLTTTVVLNVTKELLEAKSPSDFISVSSVFHSNGLNMRYLGLVYGRLVSSEFYGKGYRWLYSAIQIEALVRVAKGHLREKLRNAARKEVEGYENNALQVSIVVEFLNSFFRTSAQLQNWIDRHHVKFLPFIIFGSSPELRTFERTKHYHKCGPGPQMHKLLQNDTNPFQSKVHFVISRPPTLPTVPLRTQASLDVGLRLSTTTPERNQRLRLGTFVPLARRRKSQRPSLNFADVARPMLHPSMKQNSTTLPRWVFVASFLSAFGAGYRMTVPAFHLATVVCCQWGQVCDG